MSVYKLSSSGGVKTPRTQYSSMSAGAQAYSEMQLINSVLVGGGGASYATFLNIPQDYKSLQVRFSLRPVNATYGGSIYLIPNSGASSTGYNHYLYGNGSSTITSSNGNPSLILGQNIQSNGLTSSFNSGIVDILDYSSTVKYKTYRWFFGYTDSISNRILLGSSNWSSTSAITSLALSVDGNLAQGTRVSLYGIKG